MRRTTDLLCALTLAGLLAACRDALPTDVVRRLHSAPPYALVNGPITPINGGLVASPIVPVDNGPDNQNEPQVSGDLACYRDRLTGVHYFRFSSGVSSQIPTTQEYLDHDCSISGNRIVFARITGFTGLADLILFDVSSATVTALDPQPGSYRWRPRIGTNTVAFTDVHDGNSNDTRVVDLATPGQSLLVSGTGLDRAPNISPDDNVIVWQRCDVDLDPCDAFKSVRTGGTWSAPEVLGGSPSYGNNPDTDGSYIVYDAESPGTTGHDIHVQSVAGGPVTQLAIPGFQYLPRISAGVITLYTSATSNSLGDVSVYVIATNTLYTITNTPTVHEFDADVDVLPNGDIRVVWVANDGLYDDVYSTTFTPAAGPTFSFGGFLAPVSNPPTVNVAKAGAAIPVKFDLGGDRGLNIFASGSPSSVTMTCNAGATTGTVEETVVAGNSALTYDAASDTYSYIWKTDKAWSNTCRRLTLQFVDGSVANADFQFTR